MNPKNRIEALGLFLAGRTHREIASQLGIAKSTVTRWSIRDRWMLKREENRIAAIKEAQQAHQASFTKQLGSELGQIENLLVSALSELTAYQDGRIHRKQLKFTLRDISRLTTAYSSMQKTPLGRKVDEKK